MGTIFLDIYEYILTHMRYTIPGLLETSLKASRSPRQINFIVPISSLDVKMSSVYFKYSAKTGDPMWKFSSFCIILGNINVG